MLSKAVDHKIRFMSKNTVFLMIYNDKLRHLDLFLNEEGFVVDQIFSETFLDNPAWFLVVLRIIKFWTRRRH